MPKRNDPLVAQIGKRIYKKRKEMGLTQEKLADLSGLSQSFITCIERGEKGLGCDSIIRISSALGTSADYLLKGTADQKESDYIQSLCEIIDEEQRIQVTAILENIILISGHPLPKQK